MVISRPIILGKKLKILIDTKYFNVLLAGNDAKAKNLLDFCKSEYFEFIRTPGETSFDTLQNIPPYKLEYGGNSQYSVIKINKSEQDLDTSYTGFGFKIIPENEYLVDVLVWAALNINNPSNVFITDNNKILSERIELEANYLGHTFEIVTFDEGCEIIDIFLKYHKVYRLTSIVSFTKGGWYEVSYKSKIKRLHLGEPVQNAIVKRFTYLLMSLDEIGFQYYSGVDEDTLENTLYYFNYFIVLMTGIFDSLAQLANDKLKLGYENNTMDVSLKSNGKKYKGKIKFLNAIEAKNSELHEHIDQYTPFISCIYKLRDEVLHRIMLPDIRITTPSWKVNAIEVDENFIGYLSHYPGKPPEYDLIPEWGNFQYNEIHCLEPYHFVKSSTRMLIQFIDKYLELVDFQAQTTHLTQSFERLNIGF